MGCASAKRRLFQLLLPIVMDVDPPPPPPPPSKDCRTLMGARTTAETFPEDARGVGSAAAEGLRGAAALKAAAGRSTANSAGAAGGAAAAVAAS